MFDVNVGDRVQIIGLKGTHRVAGFSRHVPHAVLLRRHGHIIAVLISQLALPRR